MLRRTSATARRSWLVICLTNCVDGRTDWPASIRPARRWKRRPPQRRRDNGMSSRRKPGPERRLPANQLLQSLSRLSCPEKPRRQKPKPRPPERKRSILPRMLAWSRRTLSHWQLKQCRGEVWPEHPMATRPEDPSQFH